MNQLQRLAAEELSGELIAEIKDKVSIDAFCELVAAMFGLRRGSGEQIVEMCFRDGEFRWGRIHSGRIGRDHLERIRSLAPSVVEDAPELP